MNLFPAIPTDGNHVLKKSLEEYIGCEPPSEIKTYRYVTSYRSNRGVHPNTGVKEQIPQILKVVSETDEAIYYLQSNHPHGYCVQKILREDVSNYRDCNIVVRFRG